MGIFEWRSQFGKYHHIWRADFKTFEQKNVTWWHAKTKTLPDFFDVYDSWYVSKVSDVTSPSHCLPWLDLRNSPIRTHAAGVGAYSTLATSLRTCTKVETRMGLGARYIWQWRMIMIRIIRWMMEKNIRIIDHIFIMVANRMTKMMMREFMVLILFFFPENACIRCLNKSVHCCMVWWRDTWGPFKKEVHGCTLRVIILKETDGLRQTMHNVAIR